MNQGGEPGHDEYDLPRVDIEVPDDARELYRDVQEYHRELRALRRLARSRRWRAPLRRPDKILPLVAGALVLALFAGMVLTMFSANSYFAGLGRTNQTTTATSGGSKQAKAPAAARTVQLPAENVVIAGRRVPLRSLRSVVVAVIPAQCRCGLAIRRLLGQAGAVHLVVFLVGSGASTPGVASMVAALRTGEVKVATESGNALTSVYRLSGLSAVLVDALGRVAVQRRLGPGLQLEQQLRSLHPVSSQH